MPEPSNKTNDNASDTGTIVTGDVKPAPPGLHNHTLRYPYVYLWLLLLSAMDVLLTWTLFHQGAYEANPIAEYVIDRWQLNGMILYKFALITLFILICEVVGALRDATGRLLSRISILIAAVPVVWSLLLLARVAAS